MRVIVAHPNTQHSHRLALAVQKAGWLEAYVTQLYFDPSRFPYSLVTFLPKGARQKIADKLSRRRLQGLDPHRIVTFYTWAELVFIILNRAHLARRFREQWLLNRSRIFAKRVGKLAAYKADMVVGTDTASLEMFRIAQPAGVICVLDLSYAHINTCLRIEAEERQYDPVFARTFDTYSMDSEDLRNMVEEVKMADAIIVASSFSKESLLENGVDEKRIFVVPYGVDLELFQPATLPAILSTTVQNNQLNILFVGGIGQRKGVGYLLKAVHELRQSLNISTTLVGNLRGDVSVFDAYRQNFIHLNHMPRSKVAAQYQAADVFVFPSLIEGFGLVILEAMASGLPVITTPNTGGRDVITDGVDGFIVPIRDVEAIKQRLVYLYEHPEERLKMGIAARKTAEQYSWCNYEKGIASALERIHTEAKGW